jgi:hypothetical protein
MQSKYRKVYGFYVELTLKQITMQLRQPGHLNFELSIGRRDGLDNGELMSTKNVPYNPKNPERNPIGEVFSFETTLDYDVRKKRFQLKDVAENDPAENSCSLAE